jgi:hypothetical protein
MQLAVARATVADTEREIHSTAEWSNTVPRDVIDP